MFLMSDRSIYYDFSSEQPLNAWKKLPSDPKSFKVRSEFDFCCGNFLLLISDQPGLPEENQPRVLQVFLNGRKYDLASVGIPYFIGEKSGRVALEIPLKEHNEITLDGCGDAEALHKFLQVSITKPLPAVETLPPYRKIRAFPKEENQPAKCKGYDLTGFREGIGCNPSPGRFGFAKGDGMLDGAMMTLGTVCKIFMNGHPQYDKPFIWHYSTFPKDMPHHGSRSPAFTGIENDTVQINHLCVKWETEYKNTAYSCTYSLGSPGIITESADGMIRLSDLEYAGNYQYAMFENEAGQCEIISLRSLHELKTGANFLMLFGCTEFPDIPLFLVFQKRPQAIDLEFHPKSGRLSSIVFTNCPLLITATPFGLESFAPLSPEDEFFIERAMQVCRFWSRALLAYPVQCREFYKNDQTQRKTVIVQQFTYRYIQDDWGTKPLELAPLPPAATLCGTLESSCMEDFKFPSLFGHLKGAFGKCSSYTLPWMPAERKFPLHDPSDRQSKKLLDQGIKKYLSFLSSFSFPMVAYPYAGALLEPYAFASTLLPLLDNTDQETIRAALRKSLERACDPETVCDYPVIDFSFMMKENPEDEQLFSIYNDPEMKHRKMRLWNIRREPFTGQEYHICYLNVYYFFDGLLKTGSPEEIRNLNIPLIENDWGLGLTMYYIYLAAEACGDRSVIGRNWDLLKNGFRFFELMHDWACMGSGYSENGITWVEGANYGAFTAFQHLAEMADDPETVERARYLAAKQFALRLAIFHSSQQYYHSFFGVEPWYISGALRECAQISGQYLCVPDDLTKERFRPDCIYKMTTEGLYPELLAGIYETCPDEWRKIRKKLGIMLKTFSKETPHGWCDVQSAAFYLMSLALDPTCSPKTFEEELDQIKSKDLLMNRWRGIHIFSRRLPENFLEVQLRLWSKMKEQKIWLESWMDLYVLSAEWIRNQAEIKFRITGKHALLRFGFKEKPCRIMLNCSAVLPHYYGSQGEILLDQDGDLIFEFTNRKLKEN